MGVDHGRGHARVSEEFMDRADVGSAFQEDFGKEWGVMGFVSRACNVPLRQRCRLPVLRGGGSGAANRTSAVMGIGNDTAKLGRGLLASFAELEEFGPPGETRGVVFGDARSYLRVQVSFNRACVPFVSALLPVGAVLARGVADQFAVDHGKHAGQDEVAEFAREHRGFHVLDFFGHVEEATRCGPRTSSNDGIGLIAGRTNRVRFTLQVAEHR